MMDRSEAEALEFVRGSDKVHKDFSEVDVHKVNGRDVEHQPEN